MMKDAEHTTEWSTSAHGGPTESSSTDLTALKRQLDECNGSRGPLFAVQCMAETLNRIVASHFVTSVVVIAVLALLLVVGTLMAKT